MVILLQGGLLVDIDLYHQTSNMLLIELYKIIKKH
nr:MAG TPA: hypothetical protein [Caudoviricetes sp.]